MYVDLHTYIPFVLEHALDRSAIWCKYMAAVVYILCADYTSKKTLTVPVEKAISFEFHLPHARLFHMKNCVTCDARVFVGFHIHRPKRLFLVVLASICTRSSLYWYF